jgi:hypothetical protein
VQRLHGRDRCDTSPFAPGEEVSHSTAIGPAGVTFRMVPAKNSKKRICAPSLTETAI